MASGCKDMRCVKYFHAVGATPLKRAHTFGKALSASGKACNTPFMKMRGCKYAGKTFMTDELRKLSTFAAHP